MTQTDTATVPPALAEIHEFWFGELTGIADLAEAKRPIWFKRSDETDQTIRERFGDFIPRAAAIDWDLDGLSREEQVGLVLLFDQFPRNIFRDSSEAFAYDAKAREIARRLMENRDRFFLIERFFLFLPFEHSEDVADQDTAILLYAEVACDCPESFVDYARNGLDYASKHRDIIRKFGRFPHRNASLGRASTDEEEAFLAEHGRGF
jgi:uncharacterized protein (DUF924 family)